MSGKETVFKRLYDIAFDEDNHLYNNRNGDGYLPVSDAIKKLSFFDRNGISLRMAQTQFNAQGKKGSVSKIKNSILKGWDLLADVSSEYGKLIHGSIEKYFTTTVFNAGIESDARNILKKIDIESRVTVQKFQRLLTSLHEEYEAYYKSFHEMLLFSHKYKIAGTTDYAGQRTKVRSRKPIIDFKDYKTNIIKGIEFDSIKRKDGNVKHTNRYYLAPFEHIEQCNYFHYALQLSCYAFLAEQTYDILVGNLEIKYIDANLNWTNYPVPYMRDEAEKLFLHANNVKKKPELVKLPTRVPREFVGTTKTWKDDN